MCLFFVVERTVWTFFVLFDVHVLDGIETDVLYLGVRDPVGHLAITVLMQPDGTPVTYSEYTAAHALSK